MSTFYGSDFSAARIDLVILGLGVGFYLAASTISQALLAVDRATAAAKAWAVSAEPSSRSTSRSPAAA